MPDPTDEAVAELAARIRAHLAARPEIRRMVVELTTGDDIASRRDRWRFEAELSQGVQEPF
jgi:hypothetical protein